MTGLDEAAIGRTLTMDDNLIVRNLQVTLGYYHLSEGMRKVIGDRNVSWVSIATHASKTAGQAIRHELMPRVMKSGLLRAAGYDETFMFFRDALMSTEEEAEIEQSGRVAEALKRVSLLVSEGNIMVYAELARPFLEFTTTFSRLWDRDDDRLDAFLTEQLRPGAIENEGQDWLIEAFTAYYSARFETDRKRKAEYVFQGNMLVGLHEQTRLQPFIEDALLTPLRTLSRSGEGEKESRVAKMLVQRWGTRMLMSLNLPNRELKLGSDVIAPTGVFKFPSDLIVLDSPRAIELVKTFDRGDNTLSGTGAENWASLQDRMSFIVDLFRSHQQYERMFEAPFLPDQVAAIESGHHPSGPL